MKKSLIALAVLAASGASFAQVSVTGNLTYGYQGTTTGGVNGGATSDAAGFGADTARVIFTAKEDLGGGYAATAVMQVNSGATSTTQVTGAEDTTLTLATPVGGLVLGTVKGADYLSGGIAGVNAYNAGWDGKVQSARITRDMWAFVIPVGAFTFAIGQQEAATLPAAVGGTAGGLGLGVGTTGTAAQTALLSYAALTNVSVSYAAGPLAANGQYLAYKNSAGTANNKDTARIFASYDLGVAKLGAGASISNITGGTGLANGKVTDFLVAARVPMGASSFGISYNSRTWDDINATAALLGQGAAFSNGTGTGYSLEYGYAMSKRTSVIANYARWTQVGSGLTAGRDADTQYQLLLSHSF